MRSTRNDRQSNSSGDTGDYQAVCHPLGERMDAYDALPPSAREMVRNLPMETDTVVALQYYRTHGYHKLMRELRDTDKVYRRLYREIMFKACGIQESMIAEHFDDA